MLKFTEKDREYFKQLAETVDHQQDFVLAFYRRVYPDWDHISQIDGYPSISDNLYCFMSRLCQQVDRRCHPNVLAGGLWMNKGPSIDRNLAPDEIDLNTAKVTYNREEETYECATMP